MKKVYKDGIVRNVSDAKAETLKKTRGYVDHNPPKKATKKTTENK